MTTTKQTTAKVMLVVAVKDDSGGYAVAVRGNVGGYWIQMIPGSKKPAVGDGVFVVSGPDGSYGIALDNTDYLTTIQINYVLGIPQTQPDALKMVKCRIGAWELEGDVTGDVTLDILTGSPAGTSICGSSLPAISDATSATGAPDGTWTTEIDEGTNIYFVTSGVTSITKLAVRLTAVRLP